MKADVVNLLHLLIDNNTVWLFSLPPSLFFEFCYPSISIHFFVYVGSLPLDSFLFTGLTEKPQYSILFSVNVGEKIGVDIETSVFIYYITSYHFCSVCLVLFCTTKKHKYYQIQFVVWSQKYCIFLLYY